MPTSVTPGQVGEHARVVAAHDADADDTDSKRLVRGDCGLFRHAPPIPQLIHTPSADG